MLWTLFVVGLLVVGLLTALLSQPAGALVDRLLDRARPAFDALVECLGAPLAFLVVLSAGLGATLVLGMGVGFGARASGHYDWTMYWWWMHHHTHGLTAVMQTLTLMGDALETRVLAIVAGVLLIALKPRRAWLTIFAMVAVAGLEFELQQILALAIHRGHPPVGLGTYPSGGVGRLVAFTGVIVLLCTRLFEPVSRAVRTVGWTIVALLGWTELYSRVYLGKHFTSDAIGGAIFAVLLVLTVGLALSAVMGPRHDDAAGSRAAVDEDKQGVETNAAASPATGQPGFLLRARAR
ncbi:MAG: phosphatase PAP2 family protein [Acidimicrobiales bacterium]